MHHLGCTKKWCALLVFCWLSSAWSAAAQTGTAGSVTGTVRDTSDAVVAGATVEIVERGTNRRQQDTTDERGRFRLLYLPTGNYDLTVRVSGFADARTPITVGVGSQIDVSLTLVPAGVTQSLEVTAVAPLVETRRSDIAASVLPREIDSLPLNGRNYLDLAQLLPNVSRTNLRATDRFAETSAVPGTAVSVSGQRNLANTFVVDGLSANDDAAALAGSFLSEDVIQEFQVVTSGGTAEFGRASAGTINVVTKSGTNTLAGRAYEFFRDDALDARSPLSTRRDATGATLKDPLSQHQFGINAGGPFVRDRTFWFGSIERTHLDRTGIVTIAPASVLAVNNVLDTTGYGGPLIATGNYPTGYTTTNVFGRVDHDISDSARVVVRYSLYDVNSRNARNVGSLNDVSRAAWLRNRDQTVAANHLWTRGSGMIVETRAQYTRNRLAAPVNDLIGPAVNISGVASFGTATFSPTGRNLDVGELIESATVQRGTHLLKGGAGYLHNRATIEFPGALQGVYTFTSLADFQNRAYSTYQQAFGVPFQFQSNPNLGLFVQDEWRPRSDLTVNAGLRYDVQWLADPIATDTNNVSPRIGLAYAPGRGVLVIRGSGGIYFDRIPLRAVSNALQRDGTKYKVAQLSFGQAAAPVFPTVLPAFPAGVLITTTTINPAIENGSSRQASLEIERGFGRSLSAAVSYQHLRGQHIILQRNVNVPTLTAAQAAALGVANLGRPNPLFGNINQYDALGDSWFNGLTLTLTARSTPWGSARMSYTLSKALDDVGNAFFNTPQDNFDIRADKGPSDNDQRHRLVLSGTFGDGSNETIRRLLGGVRVAYLFSYASAAPFTIVTGSDRNNDTTVNDRPEGVPRNSARMPCFDDLNAVCGSSSFDLRVSREVRLTGPHRLEIMLEGFNLFNHINVVNINNTIGTGAAPSPAFKQVTAIGDMRQLQLGARWTF